MGEIRVTFNKNEEELERFIKSKTSGAGFLKDIAMIEMKKEENYINSSNINVDLLKKILSDSLNTTDEPKESVKKEEKVNKVISSVDDLSTDDVYDDFED